MRGPRTASDVLRQPHLAKKMPDSHVSAPSASGRRAASRKVASHADLQAQQVGILTIEQQRPFH